MQADFENDDAADAPAGPFDPVAHVEALLRDEDVSDATTEDADRAIEEAEADDADGDAEADEGDGGEAGEDGDEDDDAAEAEVASVDVDGVAVPVEDLKRIYAEKSRFEAEVAQFVEHRKALEADKAAVAGKLENYTALVGALEGKLAELEKANPEPTAEEWAKLWEENPIEFRRLDLYWREVREHQQAAKVEKERLAVEAVETQRAEFRRATEATKAALLEAVPEWRDPKAMSAEIRSIVAYVESIGYSRDEMNAAASTDPRLLLALRDAARMKALTAAKPKPTRAPSAPPLRASAAGGTTTGLARSSADRARAKFVASGRIDDAAALIERLL